MPLSDTQLRSLVDLLDDEDPRSLALVRERILGLGDGIIPYLEEAHDRFGPRLRERLDSVLFEVRSKVLETGFRRLAAHPEPDLESGAFLIARFGNPGLDEPRWRAWLDATARTVAGAIPDAGPEAARRYGGSYPLLLSLNRVLFEELGFRGNAKRFYDPANSYLDRVIETRRGIPISLSVLYLLLGRRLELPLAGAGIPGHFMVRWQAGRPSRDSGAAFFIDPFHEGRILTRTQCRQFLLRSGYAFREEFLQPSRSRETLARMLRNLLSIFQKAGLAAKAEQVSTLAEILLTRGGDRDSPPG